MVIVLGRNRRRSATARAQWRRISTDTDRFDSYFFIANMCTGSFEQHLREAINLNRARAPRYAVLSDTASLRISRGLLFAQHLSLPVARWLDHKAAPYHRAGIPLLERVFVSMHEVPPFMSSTPVVMQADYRPPTSGPIRREVQDAYRQAGFAGASCTLAHEIEVLSAQPCFDCMLRHLLESALRASNLAPLHIEQARRVGLPSPEWISALLLRLHLWGLVGAVWLDAEARPLQADGLPIVCQDVPHVPPWPDEIIPLHDSETPIWNSQRSTPCCSSS